MNRTIRAIVGAALVLVIAFSGISISQNLGRRWKVDVTDQKLYTLSDGTKAILGRLNQPIKIRFFYAKTAAMKGPDQIRFFNNYSEFVRALLDEYVAASNGMVELQVIDPRPFSEEEEQALRLGLRRFPITEEENFFFGLAVQTQFGVEKTIPFFSPDRQNFVEYDISYLIDTAITRQKTRVGIMSSLPVMGDDVTGYMAQMMRMQGQQPKPAWTIVEHLRQKYEVTEVPTDLTDINDVDILLVIHPKDLPERTQFAIDQFILKGGRAILCVDPHCIVDRPQQNPMQMTAQKQSSDLDRLMRTWGLSMPANTFAGDRSLLLEAPLTANQRPQPIMGFLGLKPPCFNQEKAITADLNEVRVLFAGVLREVSPAVTDPNQPDRSSDGIVRTPLIMTTDRGNSWTVSSSFDLMFPDPDKLMARFIEGTQPVPMGYLVTGRFKSSFPEGIEVEVEADDPDEDEESDEPTMVTKRVTGLTEASADCAVAVFSDVDFLSDQMAYANSLFGKMVVGDNSALLMNTIEDLSGSGDLISIRSRGNYRRPFTVVDEIERQAERETDDEVALINAQIEGFNLELQNLATSDQAAEQEEVIGSSIIEKRRQLELKIREAQRQLREVNARRRERIEHLGAILRRFNMGLVPGVIMLIALVLGLWRSFRRRHYISHASDA
ncbi:Gldg family protein [Anaerobaca lacustris]|uniref:Gldg family protein n=1 Tax=Anaerobaca lacustris TaxID=3044600 RepID=A0AAW6TYS7_9BACT|nr:Gldg family protein [Sedimentisphaerales bacterium M17dextr]